MSSTIIEPFISHIQKKVHLMPEELEEFIAPFNLKQIKKKQLIIQPEFVAKYRYYVLNGAFRGYVIDEEGVDHTIQLAIEDWWISDYNSYMLQRPATMFVVALEDSTVLQISYDNEQKLKGARHRFETIFRMMAERSAAYQQRRIISSLTQSAEERYNQFVTTYPLMVQRIPQYALASYLGMTTEFLSKIRNKKLRKKT